MAKILLANTGRSPITLHVKRKDGVHKLTIPAAKQDKEQKNKTIFGTAEADDSFMKHLEKNEVIAAYFESGVLKVQKPGEESASEPATIQSPVTEPESKAQIPAAAIGEETAEKKGGFLGMGKKE